MLSTMNTKIKRLTALNYLGGKSRFTDWVLPLLNVPHLHYVEPFCGGASVFLNKKRSPIETISDKSGLLINFFRVLREQPAALISLLQLTPLSRNEFEYAKEQSDCDLEAARRFFLLCNTSFGGRVGSGRESMRIAFTETRCGVSMEVNKLKKKVAGLYEVAARLMDAQIENRSAAEMITQFDGPETLFYLDPPYLREVRTSTGDSLHEMTTPEHETLLQQIISAKGKVAISGYDSGLYNDRLSGWEKHYGPDRLSNLGKKAVREIIWTNYKIKIETLF